MTALISIDARKRFDDLCNWQEAEALRRLPVRVGEIRGQMFARGIGDSSIAALEIQKAFAAELESLAAAFWQNLVRVHQTQGRPLESGLRAEFKDMYGRRLHGAIQTLAQRYEGEVSRMSSARSVENGLFDRGQQLLQKHEIEADLYVDSLESRPRSNGSNVTNTYNFHAPVGAVQTGPNAVANVVQNLGQGDRDALVGALKQVADALVSDGHLDAQRKTELREIAHECLEEIESANPNNTKLMASLNILGISIQAIAAAQPAYQALRAALIPIGILLP